MISTLLSVSSVFTFIGYIAIAILILLLMVLIHELGHYVAGKMLKFDIVEFSIGFGPKIFQKKKKNGELVTLRAFPLGGYCAFDGETDEGTNSPGAYHKQAPWKRLIVLFFGAFFNFLSGIIFSFILLIANGYEQVEVKNIDNTSINYEILQQSDVIYGIEGVEFDFVNDKMFNSLVEKHINNNYATYNGENLLNEYSFENDEGKKLYIVKQPLTFNVERDGERIESEGYVSVIYDAEGKVYQYSFYTNENTADTEFKIGYHKYSFGESLMECVPFTFKWAYKVLIIFGDLITGKLGLDALTGPVGTINLIATQTQANASFVLLLLPLLAVNLAVFNLLPIPALDGFQMVFTTIEWIRKKPIKQEVINIINNVGLIALLGFVIIIDLLQFVF